MSLIGKILKIGTITLAGISLFLVTFTGCMNFRKSTKAFKKDFKEGKVEVEIKTDSFNNKEVRYLSYKVNDTLPTLIFVHGAPGSATSFSDYILDSSLNPYYNMIVIDRLGYGYSDYGCYTSLDEQANWLAKFVNEIPSSHKVFLIGHSFGGPIVARTAVKLKERLSGTIMIAPALDPENEKYFPGGKLAYWKATRWMFSGAWRVSASEKYRHAKELKGIEPDWSEIETPVLHIHGTTDKLVPYSNLAYAQKNFNKNTLEVYSWDDNGHLIPFTEQKKTINLITSFVKKHI